MTTIVDYAGKILLIPPCDRIRRDPSGTVMPASPEPGYAS